MRAQDSRTATRMKVRLAEALWSVLEDCRLDAVSVGAVAARADVSRGSFYYHFADLDELVAWALRRELMDVDHAGTPLVALLASSEGLEPLDEVPLGVARLCLLINHGGMDVAYDAAVGLALDFWRSVLAPDGGELEEREVALVEFALGGVVGTLCHAPFSTEFQRRATVSFLRECARAMTLEICDERGVSEKELLARIAADGCGALRAG